MQGTMLATFTQAEAGVNDYGDSLFLLAGSD